MTLVRRVLFVLWLALGLAVIGNVEDVVAQDSTSSGPSGSPVVPVEDRW